jgi:hypothetical protein
MERRSEQDAETHRQLVAELTRLFSEAGYIVSSADDVVGYSPPLELPNDGYGDQEEKAPDVYAFDPTEQRYVIGEAKTGNGDLETEHALTQYNVFLDQIHRTSGKRAMVYIIVPESVVPEFNTLMTRYIHPDLYENLAVVKSSGGNI